VQVLATPGQFKALLGAPGISYVRAPLPHDETAVTGEGVASSNALGVHLAGNTGAGVKIAVIDGGFAGLAAAQGSGDLPASVTTVDYCHGGFDTATNHGTAVAEIVHEMAPDATLYLICIFDEVDLASAESYAKANGVSVINHSVAWYNSSRGDGSGGAGSPDAIAADAVAHGILWVNAAGNDATRHWSGSFIDSGVNLDIGGGEYEDAHRFASGDIGNSFDLAYGQVVCATLKWDDWPYSGNDFDLILLHDSTSEMLWGSWNFQTGYQPPIESFCWTNDYGTGTYSVAIGRYDATSAPRFDLFLYTGPSLQYQTAAGSVAEPASSPSVLAVGAQCWNATTIQSFSSQGPTIGGQVKPNITGPDQVSGTTFGAFSSCAHGDGFAGTSAAAPHVAGAAALVKSANPAFTVAQIKSFLQASAVDEGAAGNDNVYGYGLLHLPSRPMPPTAVTAVAYHQSALVSWAAPVDDGGSPIIDYTVTAVEDGTKTCSTTGARTCTVSGLTNGTPYTFTVRATNAIGTSLASDPSAPVTPIAVPGAPVVTAIGYDSRVVVSWTAADDHGSAVTGYTLTSSPAGLSCTTTALTCSFSGLTNKTTYTISVTASNANGTGPAGTTTATPRAGNSYVGLTPTRVLDSSTGLQRSGKLEARTWITFDVASDVPRLWMPVPDDDSAGSTARHQLDQLLQAGRDGHRHHHYPGRRRHAEPHLLGPAG
jgi:subtilisin family serine protease